MILLVNKNFSSWFQKETSWYLTKTLILSILSFRCLKYLSRDPTCRKVWLYTGILIVDQKSVRWHYFVLVDCLHGIILTNAKKQWFNCIEIVEFSGISCLAIMCCHSLFSSFIDTQGILFCTQVEHWRIVISHIWLRTHKFWQFFKTDIYICILVGN